LAALPHEAAEKGLERSLREYPRSPAFDADKFWREIETIRSEFVAFDREQHASGISAIGTAIGDPNGGFVAISIPVPTARFSRNEARLVERLLVNRKHIISKLSGSRPTVS
jgi:DNA-binding IclR family transcriptional regulator